MIFEGVKIQGISEIHGTNLGVCSVHNHNKKKSMSDASFSSYGLQDHPTYTYWYFIYGAIL
jgi:hypothetical protein